MLNPNAVHVSMALVALALMTCYLSDVNALGVGVAATALCVALKAAERALRRRERERKTIEVLENDTRRLITNFLLDFVGVFHRKKKSEAHSTMKKVVRDFIEIDRHYGNGMTSYVVASELRLDERGDDMSFVAAAASTLFGAGACPAAATTTTTTWEHVATLLFFGALVSQDLMRERESERCVELVSREISTYLLSHHRDWLLRNNSWDGFVEHFRKSFRYDFEKNHRESCVCH